MRKEKFHFYKQFFSFNEIDEFYNDRAIIDAKGGGLLLGPSHHEGGIFFLFEYDHGFHLFGEVEGYEYIVRRRDNNHLDALPPNVNDKNRDYFNDFIPYEVSNEILTIDATSPNNQKYKAKYIILDVRGGFGIINKYSTKKYLNLIDKFNKNINMYD